MFVILPFEKAFYQRFGVGVDFVGHPLLDAIEKEIIEHPFKAEEFLSKNKLTDKPLIALLPGSRKQDRRQRNVAAAFPDRSQKWCVPHS